MPGPTISVLVLEDSLLDLELTIAELESGSFTVEYSQATTSEEFLTAIESGDFELIIADYNLPTYDGLTALAEVRKRDKDIPFILVSGTLDEADAIKSMYAGATDYVQKNRLFRLVPVVIRAMREYRERKQIRALQMVLEQRNQAIESAHNGIILIDSSVSPAITTFANDAYARIIGRPLNEIVGQALSFLDPNSKFFNQTIASLLFDLREGKAAGSFLRPNATACNYELHLSKVGHHEEGAPSYIGILIDITERVKLEQQAIKQARLAVVGQLAAGIAHDFNNIMAVITMNSDLIGLTPNLPSKTQDRVNLIIEQSKHASNLIQQILDFSRQTVQERHPLYLDTLISRMLELWQRTIKSNIKFEYINHARKGIIQADRTRLEQAFMNLIVNARDALENGGHIKIEVNRVQEQPGDLLTPLQGNWLCLKIHDNGTGIADEHLPYLFEPFFTTKGPDDGTGLGLAQVYGIVAQHDGHIQVDSQVGVGTTFTIYLPEIVHKTHAENDPPTGKYHLGSQESIMVVEDNTAIRSTLVEALRNLNYNVTSTKNGYEAIEALDTAEVDIIITDLIMPEMGGEDLIAQIRQKGLNLPIVLFSGYDLSTANHSHAQPNIIPLKKPVELAELSSHLRAILSG